MPGRAPKVTRDDIIEAVQRQCEFQGVPAVPTRDVTDDEGIEVGRQTVYDKLDSLNDEGRVGRISIKGDKGSAWWVPESEKVDVDFNTVAWENINGEDIPKETIEQHPDYHSPDLWERWEGKAAHAADFTLLALIVALPILLLDEYAVPLITIGSDLQAVGTLSLLVGFSLGFIAIVVNVGAKLGRLLDRHGAGDTLLMMYNWLRSWFAKRTNYRITRVDPGTEE